MDVDILENLKKAVTEYDVEKAEALARKAIEAKIDPLKAAKALIEGVTQIGDAYGRGELFLPDLVGAGDVMQHTMPILEEEIKRQGKERQTLGSVVIGTVYGDIHTIGKDMVATFLTAAGFLVHDTGINVTAEQFVDAVKEYQADILAMSALMTMTASEQGKVIEALKKEGLREGVKIMVGGSAVTQEFADSIGADGYESTAPSAAGLAKRLIGMK